MPSSRVPSRVTPRAGLLALLLLTAAAPVRPLPAQGSPAAPAVATARAVRTTAPVQLDGRDDDPVWRAAPVTDEFFQFTPAEAVPARFRTAFQVAYDDRTLYVFTRMYDPRPDSIVSLLSRRDVKTPSEWIKVVIDGFHDRRSAMQFMVNPAGVKRDATVFQDVQEDNAWDGVWDVAVRTDSLGWTAEFAIPFSQLRYDDAAALTFGFGVWRDVARFAERDAWPVYRPSRQTFASQLGDLVGIRDIGRNRRLELMPYVVSRNVTQAVPGPTPGTVAGWEHPQQQSAGLDLKAGLGPNVTLDATINPDFGQVEADPAVLNLSAFEVRFEERRPFFLEGTNIFRCNGPCEGIFYTRRMGRPPQLASSPRDPRTSAILGAAKVTGRFAGGAQFGLVAVRSDRERGQAGQTIEPATSTLVGRLVQDFRGGRSQLGTMLTALTRDLDDDTAPFLRREAYTALLQGYHRFADRWEVSGYAGRSVARGSRAAIARTQLSSVHYFQRPDHEETFDSARTAMDGGVTSLSLRRYAGRVRWETMTRYAEAGTELNDLGFVTLVNDAQVRNQLSLVTVRPTRLTRRANAVATTENHWTTGGLPTGATLQLHGAAEFVNFLSASVTYNLSNLGNTLCVSCARGGPLLRVSPYHRVSLTFDGDARRAVTPSVDLRVATGDEGRSWAVQGAVGVLGRVGTRTSLEAQASYERRSDDTQPVRNYGALFSDTVHYTFAALQQDILGVTVRANVTLSPTLSLQLYAQPFVASGAYSDWREMTDPRARRYPDRYAPWGAGAVPAGFNSKQFNSNAVLRWEYRPGSVLFVVWQQGRADARNPGTFDAGRDLRDLFYTHPDNTLLVKLSYWLNP
ncbi:MAG: carbohydrate binding family 9 domain-containing protein [Gemmatimonadaceae bacterium]|nr:carbohydrate binding family 9 domain-containing protein [Gemmatimonadaceae bacterium]